MAKLPTDGVPPLLFYLAGVTCWSYFADCVSRTSFTFISNAAIFGKVYFPRLSVPLLHVIFSMIKFAIQLALFLVFLIFYRAQGARVQPTAAIALTPLLLLLEVCDELQLRSPVTGCLGPEPTHEENTSVFATTPRRGLSLSRCLGPLLLPFLKS